MTEDLNTLREALKPCPFCGGEARAFKRTCNKDDRYDPGHRAYPIVRCGKCGCCAEGDDWTEPQTAVERCNRRAPRLEAAAAPEENDLTLAYMKGFSDGGAKADHIVDANKKVEADVPELSREDVVRLAKLSGILINPALGVYADDESKLHFFAALCRTLPTGDEKCAPDPDCEYCQGTGEADSGGIHPWGAQASIRCRCTYPAVPVGEVKPVAWREAVLDLIDDCPGLTMEQDHWLSRRVKELDFPSAPPAPPKGWRMVPVEPTPEMIEAAYQSDREYSRRNFGDGALVMQGPYDHYVAMLAAAPQPGDKA